MKLILIPYACYLFILLDENCYSCTAGFYCPVGADTPLACQDGYYSMDGAMYCDECPAGSQCTSTTAQVGHHTKAAIWKIIDSYIIAAVCCFRKWIYRNGVFCFLVLGMFYLPKPNVFF